jgi:hypothetical protein
MKKIASALGLFVCAVVASGCATEVEEGASSSQDELSRGQVCAMAATAAAAATGVAVKLTVGTGVCVGGTAITVAGEVACLVPLSGAAASYIAALAAGAISWVSCSTSASQSQPKKVVVTRSSSSANECKVGNDRYCRNLNRHYKQACGSDQFSSLTDCKSLRGCADIEAMIVRAARCKAGRVRFGQDCAGSGIDRGDHRTPINDANNKLAACQSKFELPYLGCSGDADDIADAAVDAMMKDVYRCQ